MSPKTIKNIHGVVHKGLQQALEINYITANPSNACKLPRVEKTKIKPLSEIEISNFLKSINGHQFEDLFLFTLFTGMRQGEVLGLTWDSVDLQNGTILIYQQLQRIEGVYMFVSLKNDRSRNITLPPSIIKLLQEHKAVQNQWRLIAGSAWEDSNLVFSNQLGGHLAHVTVSTNYKKIVKSIGLPEARFHDLRHSYAVAALQSGDDIKSVQENLGHHTASFTLDVYGHVSDRMKTESANRMESFIKGVKNL
ncbi:tyrosine-type recombinase/integrase [Acetobacterium woodii]|uniref:DNA integration/recombination/inversion protein n=1 Tax=Acetobacterium woodii (strain ATCC 29683 / DSM 1030 / JCM 2381 / KCTC 1655 / WB1) TaxID=931626 RepID=H6LF35_ACEWD|nr:site-specific integrase [Acetobacterium woodii]AFA46941.1 DNA integration/recombination/inversion protein [Acetobacterium woodii DSM 1030]